LFADQRVGVERRSLNQLAAVQGTVVEQRSGLRVKGNKEALDAYVLLALP